MSFGAGVKIGVGMGAIYAKTCALVGMALGTGIISRIRMRTIDAETGALISMMALRAWVNILTSLIYVEGRFRYGTGGRLCHRTRGGLRCRSGGYDRGRIDRRYS